MASRIGAWAVGRATLLAKITLAPGSAGRPIGVAAVRNLSAALTGKDHTDLVAAASRCFSSSDDSHSDFKPVRKSIPTDKDEIRKMIEGQVKDNKLMLYMKGTPSAPSCGFSMQVVRILHAQGVDFASVNVLDYPAIREGIKEYSEWPTIPQVYMNGEFIGGCDILTQLHQSGELEEMFRKAGLLSE